MSKLRGGLTESVGLTAVIASLLFLGYEIRQSNRIARSTISFELADNYSEINEQIWTDPDVAALRVRVRDSTYEPTVVERERLLGEIRRLLNVWGAVESAYRNGFQTQEQFHVMLEDVRSVLNDYPGTRGLWATELDTHAGLSSFEFYALARALTQ